MSCVNLSNSGETGARGWSHLIKVQSLPTPIENQDGCNAYCATLDAALDVTHSSEIQYGGLVACTCYTGIDDALLASLGTATDCAPCYKFVNSTPDASNRGMCGKGNAMNGFITSAYMVPVVRKVSTSSSSTTTRTTTTSDPPITKTKVKTTTTSSDSPPPTTLETTTSSDPSVTSDTTSATKSQKSQPVTSTSSPTNGGVTTTATLISQQQASSNALSGGAIGGIAAAALVLIIAVGIAIYFLATRKKSNGNGNGNSRPEDKMYQLPISENRVVPPVRVTSSAAPGEFMVVTASPQPVSPVINAQPVSPVVNIVHVPPSDALVEEPRSSKAAEAYSNAGLFDNISQQPYDATLPNYTTVARDMEPPATGSRVIPNAPMPPPPEPLPPNPNLRSAAQAPKENWPAASGTIPWEFVYGNMGKGAGANV